MTAIVQEQAVNGKQNGANMDQTNTRTARRSAYDSGPGWIVIGDQPDRQARGATLVEAAGGRVLQTSGVHGGAEAMASALLLDGLLLLLRDADDAQRAPLLAMAAQRAALEDLTILVDCPLSALDGVSAFANGPAWHLLCDATDADLLATLSFVMPTQQRLVADVANEADAIRLQRLADEVSRIARTLANLSPLDSYSAEPARAPFRDAAQSFRHAPTLAVADSHADASEIRAMIRVRRLRDRFFQPELFADPAWDMLLDLAAARLEQAQVAVSSLCIAAAVPPTTALRWIKAMTDQGLFERCADPDDGRRIFIRLADSAADAMFAFFSAAKRQGGQMI